MRRALALAAVAALGIAPGCTKQLYEGEPLPPERVAVIQVGSALVRAIDGQPRRGGYFDVGQYEVPPGTHRLTLVFELPQRTLGMKTLPAQQGEGTCELVFAVDAGKQYFLGTRALDEPLSKHWSGRWEGWVRDPSISAEDDIIARCSSRPAPGEAETPHRTAAIAAATPAAAAPASGGTAPAGAAAPVAAAAPPAAPVDTIRLGTWNVRSLGRHPDKDYDRVALAIEQHFDILTLIEVAPSSDGAHAGYDRLLAALGAGWGGLISPAPRPASGELAEYYAIVYRRDRVHLCAGWESLRVTGAGEPAAEHFLHPPAFACFEAGDPNTPGVDFVLAAYHAPSADGDAATIAAEVAELDEVFTAMKLARPGEDDLIIAGDFHLESVELPRIERARDRTQGEGATLNLLGARGHALTDHILVYDEQATREMLGDADVLDVRGVAPSPGEFYRTVSDHLPIMVRLRASGPDDD